jgi:arylsulfatase A-like enzyme
MFGHFKENETFGLAVLAFAIVFSLPLFVFVGCSGEKDSQGGKTLCKKEKVYVRKKPAFVPPSKEPAPKAERVMLIVVDALRASALGCYGYPRPVSPNLDRLTTEAITFEKFYGASTWTLPAFATMLTGVSPQVNNVKVIKIGNEKADAGPGKGRTKIRPIHDKVPTLPEILEKFNTGAIVNNIFLHPNNGFSRGFDTYDHRPATFNGYRKADETVDLGLEWLEEHGDEPFFFMLHIFDPHVPYNPPKRYFEKFAMGSKGRINNKSFSQFKKLRRGELTAHKAEQEYMRGLYDGEVAFTDEEIGRLLSEMRSTGLLDKTWIIITSDHGEEIFDRGGVGHGHRFEDEVTRLPLIIRAPGGKWNAGRWVSQTARHVDLPATILDWLGVKIPEHFEGRSLTPLIDGTETSHRPAYIEHKLRPPPGYAWFDGRYKYIRNSKTGKGYIFDLEEDPGEHTPFRSKHPSYNRLKKEMSDYRSRLSEARKHLGGGLSDAVLTPEQQKSLRALGYLE